MSATLNKVVDMLMTGGQREEALRTYQRSRDLVEALAKAEPDTRQLDQAGKLGAEQKTWIGYLEQALAELPK